MAKNSASNKWTFYAARRVVINGTFDPRQLDDCLEVGLMPQIYISDGLEKPDVQKALVLYLKTKGLLNPSLKLPTHGDGVFVSKQGIQKVYSNIDVLAELNKIAGTLIFGEIVFHAGFMHFFDAFHAKQTCSLPLTAARFSVKTYIAKLKAVQKQIARAVIYAKKKGITLLVENIPAVDYAEIDASNLKNSSIEVCSDPRWGSTLFIPEEVQFGALGCAKDLNFLMGKNSVCLDIEHLSQTVEYSKLFNLERFPITPSSPEEKQALSQFGILVQYEKSILFDSPVDPAAIIRSFNQRVPLSHLGGQVSAFYDDLGKNKIGSHMPITFGAQENIFIEDPQLLLTQNKRREQELTLYIAALHTAGCRRGVFELHVGEYMGDIWKKYHRIALNNVQNVVTKLSTKK